MNIYGIIILSLLGVVLVVLITKMILDLVWNKRLNTYKKANNIEVPTKAMNVVFYRRILITALTTCLAVVVVASGVFNLPYEENFYGKTLVSARTTKDSSDIRQRIEVGFGKTIWDLFPNVSEPTHDMDIPESPADGSSSARDFVNTNLQEIGVDEGDIIKTDGSYVYFVSQYQLSRVNRVFIQNDGTIESLDPIIIPQFQVTEMYLTEEKLVLIGYKIQQMTYNPQYDELDYVAYPSNWYLYLTTATVKVFDRETNLEEFEFVTDGHIQTHRIIDNHLYLINQQYIDDEQEDLRPTFKITEGGITTQNHVDYNDIIYFEDIPATNYLVITTINLDNYQYDSQAVLGTYSMTYVSQNGIYLVGSYTKYNLFTSYSGTQLVKYSLDRENSTVMYVGQASLSGYVQNQFWLDEQDDMIRVVTTFTSWSDSKNRLYIFKENDINDNLELVGLLEDGLGKPQETVKSVRFVDDIAYVVTFLTKDPLYTISLVDPTKPEITSFIEESGYNTYLHPFGDNKLIGIGYDEFFNVKISAYLTDNTSEPLQTIKVGIDSGFEYMYSWSEALWNHKAILVSAQHGFIAFTASGYDFVNLGVDSTWRYFSSFFVFKIDFEGKPIINEPLIISHGFTQYETQIERGIYIDGIIYTFSYDKVVATNLSTGDKVDEENFDISNDNFGYMWATDQYID